MQKLLVTAELAISHSLLFQGQVITLYQDVGEYVFYEWNGDDHPDGHTYLLILLTPEQVKLGRTLK